MKPEMKDTIKYWMNQFDIVQVELYKKTVLYCGWWY